MTADKRPCKGRNSNICVAEGCYGEACIRSGHVDFTTSRATGAALMTDDELDFEQTIYVVITQFPLSVNNCRKLHDALMPVVREALADCHDAAVELALDYAVRNDDGITLHLDKPNPYRDERD